MAAAPRAPGVAGARAAAPTASGLKAGFADDNKQFNFFVRVCDEKPGAKAFEVANCKDTLVVDHILR